MCTLDFSKKNYVTVNNIQLPVPEGYHSGKEAEHGGWIYVVPRDYSLEAPHIDAKPFSFAVVSVPAAQLPIDVQHANKYISKLSKVGILKADTLAYALVLSSKCVVYYQTWADFDDPVYNKMNGVLVADSNAYVFHVFENYDAPIATQEDVLQNFFDVALQWVGRIALRGDAPFTYSPEQSTEQFAEELSQFGRLTAGQTALLGDVKNYETELKTHFITLAALLYHASGISLNDANTSYVASLTGQPLSEQQFDAIQKETIRKYGDLSSYLESYVVRRLISKPITLDKIANSEFYEGPTRMYLEMIDEFLQRLCINNGVHFASDDFYRKCILGYRKIFINVWTSNRIEVFPKDGLGSISGVVLGEDTPVDSVDSTEREDFEIDDNGYLSDYYGADSNVAIPRGVKIIGESAFLNKQILSVVIPEGVTELQDSAFWGCEQLKSVQLPSSMQIIGPNAFYRCESLTAITIPEGVTAVNGDAFTFCKALKSIDLPTSLQEIGEDAFCTFCDETVLQVLPGSIAENYAIENNLIFTPKRVTSSSQSTKKQKKTTTGNSPVTAGVSSEGFTIEKNKLIGFVSNTKEVIIPNGVTAIATEAHTGDTVIERLVIPEGVKTIGKRAFTCCSHLTEVVLPETLTSLSGFNGCHNLRQIYIPSAVTTIGVEAFFNCMALREIVLPYGVKKISKNAFWNCICLQNVHLPASITDIHEDAFADAAPAAIYHVAPGSYAETFAKKKQLKYDYDLAEYSTDPDVIRNTEGRFYCVD